MVCIRISYSVPYGFLVQLLMYEMFLPRYYVSIGLASAEGGVGELTEVRRIAQFFRIMRIVRIFKVVFIHIMLIL